MSSFPEPRQWNGDDDRPMRSANGQPDTWKCLDCPAGGIVGVTRSEHWYTTGHHIVWSRDPRAKDAPRESRDPQPETETMTADGQGRR